MIAQFIAVPPEGTLATLVAVGVVATAWVLVHRQRIDATERLTDKALEGADPADRAKILRAGGELASNLQPGVTQSRPPNTSRS